MKKIHLGAAVAAVCAGSMIAGCGSSGGTSSADASASGATASGTTAYSGTINVGVAFAAPEQMLWFIAQDKGYFKKQGLDVNVQIVPSAQALSALASGSIQFFATQAPQIDGGILNNIPVKIVGTWALHSDACFFAQPGIKSVADLKGKSVAASAAGAFSTVFAQLAVESAGLKIPGDVTAVPVTDPVGAFAGGQIAGFVANPVQQAQLKAKLPGSSCIHSYKDVDWPGAEVGGYTPFITAHKDATVGVLTALNQALKDWNSNPALAKQTEQKYINVTDQSLLDAGYTGATATFTKSVEGVPADVEKNVLKVLNAHGVPAAGSAKASSLIDGSYAAKIKNQ
jgi:NitT/TauT family transport system substrate-binding protein